MKKPNINQVAELAGVSTATVSHVINNTRYVSEEVRARVLNAIDEIGYYPSSVARSLASNKSCIVGVVFSEIINPFYTSAYRGIEDELKKSGYEIILSNTGEDPDKQEAALKTFFSRSVDGIILAPISYQSKMLKKLRSAGTSIVLFDRSEQNFPSVVINNEHAAYKIVKHLIDDGHRKIGLISGRKAITTSIERKNGYIRALQENNIEIKDQWIYEGNSLQDSGYKGARYLLGLDEKPSAIFCTNNLMTLGVLHAFRDMKLQCPDEIAFAGFDDHEWADIFTPPLTVVRQPTYEMGERAAQVLIDRMETNDRKEVNEEKEVFEGELIVRGSCSPTCLAKYMQSISE